MQTEHQLIEINLWDITVEGELVLPDNPIGFIIFSHGSGTSMHNPRNKYLAEKLKEERLGYLLFDLLTREEDHNVQSKYDLERLTHRLIGVTKWIEKLSLTRGLGLGYFGAGTGAATAIKAAVKLPGRVKTIVIRSGRPDMAYDDLYGLDIPVLLIAGNREERNIRLNEKAAEQLPNSNLVIIDGASQLFEEPGMLEKLSMTAVKWFQEKIK